MAKGCGIHIGGRRMNTRGPFERRIFEAKCTARQRVEEGRGRNKGENKKIPRERGRKRNERIKRKRERDEASGWKMAQDRQRGRDREGDVGRLCGKERDKD